MNHKNVKRAAVLFTVAMVVLAVSGIANAHGISPEARQRMIDGGSWEYFVLGAEHMVTGYDHLLFLFGVVFFLTRFFDILKYVTAFTIGHTITLVAATYLGITANYYLVDAFIALTVIYKGFENLGGFRKWLGINAPDPVKMVLFFGLVHGFGLSTRLQQLPVDEGGNTLLHILSFNAGVEVGQIAALLIMFALLFLIRKAGHSDITTRLTNGILMFLGMVLLMMQLHGYSHEAWREDFQISRDDHAHAHIEAAETSRKAAELAAGPNDASGHAHNPDGSHLFPEDEHGAPAPEAPQTMSGPDSDHGHVHNPDGSHLLPGDEHGAPAPGASKTILEPDSDHGHAHNPDGSHEMPNDGAGHDDSTPPHP